MNDVQGTVKWYNLEKGYGFATTEDGGDVFIHYDQIVGDGFEILEEGDILVFDIVQGFRGPQAGNIQKIGSYGLIWPYERERKNQKKVSSAMNPKDMKVKIDTDVKFVAIHENQAVFAVRVRVGDSKEFGEPIFVGAKLGKDNNEEFDF